MRDIIRWVCTATRTSTPHNPRRSDAGACESEAEAGEAGSAGGGKGGGGSGSDDESEGGSEGDPEFGFKREVGDGGDV